MSFLAPLYIAGSLLISLPIILHLIRRSPRDRVPFSSLMFLSESPPQVTRRSRLENIWLLLLRAAALALLAFAFARPFWREPVHAAAARSDLRVVAIGLDTSASMRREDLWQRAVDRAGQALAALRPVDHAMVFTFDRDVNTLVRFDEWVEIAPAARVDRVRAMLDRIEPSWHAGATGMALTLAADAVDSYTSSVATPDVMPDQQILLISDLQRGGDLSGLRQYEWPDDVRAELAVIAPKHATNASLQLVEERDEFSEADESGMIRVRVAAASDSDRDRFRLRWDGSDAKATDVYLAPGKSRVIRVPLAADGAPAALLLEGDDQVFDNRLYVVGRRPEVVSILYLGAANPADTASPLFYFQRAFPNTPWRSVQVNVRRAEEPVTTADLKSVRLAVVADALPGETAEALNEFIKAGGCVVGVLTERNVANSLAHIMDADDWPAEEADAAEYSMLGEIDFNHPLFAPFADPRYGDFTKIHFWRHRRIDPDQFVNARVAARFDNGDPAIIDIPLGQGRMIVFTFGWQPADSQLAVSSKFVPLLGGLLDYTMGNRTAGFTGRVGGVLNLSGLTAARVRLPNGTETTLTPGQDRFEGTDEPGIYTIEGPEADVAFAVNIEPSESQTEPLATEELEQLGVRLTAGNRSSRIVEAVERQRQLHALELEAKQKLWQSLLVAVLAILLVETWLAGRSGTVRSQT